MRVKLIITDFDGPINDLHYSKLNLIKKLFISYSVNYSDNLIANLINLIDNFYYNGEYNSYKSLIKDCLNYLSKNGDLDINYELLEAISSDFSNEIFDNLKPNTLMLDYLSNAKYNNKNLKICIYTSQHTDYVKKYLLLNKIDISFFCNIYGSDKFIEKKPSIKNLETICLENSVSFSETIMIGDEPTLDLLPAKLLGIKTALFNNLVDHHIKSESDIIDLLS